jgi:hypothetical protein
MQNPLTKKLALVLPLAAICLLFATIIAFAQVQAGRIVSTVYDPQRAAVPGAAVTVTDVATNISKRVITDGTGGYVVTPLNLRLTSRLL